MREWLRGDVKDGSRRKVAMADKRDVFSSLTGLKGIFILGIVLFHSNAAFDAPLQSICYFVYQYGGWIGNIMFFMLSGFLMSYGYKEKIRDQNIKFSTYVKKRLIKLYPIYFVTNLVQLLLIIYIDGIDSINWKLALLFVSMVSCGWIWPYSPYNYPCWFVSVLFLCYIIYYIICIVAKERRKIYPCGIALLIVWGYFLETKDWNIPFCYLADGQAFFNFFIGCGIYELYSYLSDNVKKKIAVIGALGILGFVLFLEDEILVRNEGLLLSVFICPVILLNALEFQWLGRLLRGGALQWLGKISKWIYFWHIPFFTIFMIFMDNGILSNFDNAGGYVCYLFILCFWSSVLYYINLKTRSIDFKERIIGLFSSKKQQRQV